MSKAHPPELKKLMDKRLTLKLNANRQVIFLCDSYDIIFVIIYFAIGRHDYRQLPLHTSERFCSLLTSIEKF
jgi:hypothetical protein